MFPFSPRDSPPSVHNLSSLSSAPPRPLPLLHPPCNLKWVSHGAVVRPCFSCHCRHFLCWRMKHFYFWSGVWALHPRQFRLIYGLLNFLSENWLQHRPASFFFFLLFFFPSEGLVGWLVGWCHYAVAEAVWVGGSWCFVCCLRTPLTASVFSYITYVAAGLNRLVGLTAPSRLSA